MDNQSSLFDVYFVGALAMFVFLALGTNAGPLSSSAGPFFLACILLIAGVLSFTHGQWTIFVVTRRTTAIGLLLFGGIWLAALSAEHQVLMNLTIQSFSVFASFVVVTLLVSLVTRRALSAVLLVALCVAAAINHYEFFVAPNTWSLAPGRAAGLFVNSNESAAVIAGLLALWLAVQSHRIWFSWAVGLFAVSAIVVTFSRGGIAIVMLGCLGALHVPRVLRRGITLGQVTLAATGAFMLGWLLSSLSSLNLAEDAAMRLESLLTGAFDDSSSLTRELALRIYLDRFFDNPLTGAGAFGTLLDVDGMGPHNAFVAAGSDFGIGGLCVYLGLIGLGFFGSGSRVAHSWHGEVMVVCSVWFITASVLSHNVFYSSWGAMFAGILCGAACRPVWLGR
jgi:hypothetical protein